MAHEQIQKVKVWVGNTSTDADVRILNWDSRERLIRGAKMLALCWGLALVSVFIPVLHFVLVPVFFLVGPFLFYINYRQEDGIAGGQGVCPKCEKNFDVVSGKLRWPIFEICNHCESHLRLEK